MVTFLTQINTTYMKQDTGLSSFCEASLFYGAARDTSAEKDDF